MLIYLWNFHEPNQILSLIFPMYSCVLPFSTSKIFHASLTHSKYLPQSTYYKPQIRILRSFHVASRIRLPKMMARCNYVLYWIQNTWNCSTNIFFRNNVPTSVLLLDNFRQLLSLQSHVHNILVTISINMSKVII